MVTLSYGKNFTWSNLACPIYHLPPTEYTFYILGCKNISSSYQGLVKHISSHHWKRTVKLVNNFVSVATANCPIGGCASQKVQSLKELSAHIASYHFANNQTVSCPFKNCNYEYNIASSYALIDDFEDSMSRKELLNCTDVAALLVHEFDNCGIANFRTTSSCRSFSVTKKSCATGY